MTVNSNYATVIATLRDPYEKQNPNQLQVVRVIFPTPWTSYRKLLEVLISSLRCLLLLWLTAVISLALIFRQPSKNGYKTTKNGLQWSILSRQLTVVYHKAFFFFLNIVSFSFVNLPQPLLFRCYQPNQKPHQTRSQLLLMYGKDLWQLLSFPELPRKLQDQPQQTEERKKDNNY